MEITGSSNVILLWPKCINTPWDGSLNWSHGLLIFPYNSLKFPCSWNGSLRLISVNYQQWKRITWPSNDSQQLICSKWNTNKNKIEEVFFNKSKKKLQFYFSFHFIVICVSIGLNQFLGIIWGSSDSFLSPRASISYLRSQFQEYKNLKELHGNIERPGMSSLQLIQTPRSVYAFWPFTLNTYDLTK